MVAGRDWSLMKSEGAHLIGGWLWSPLQIFFSMERHDIMASSCNEEREANDNHIFWLPHCAPQAPGVLETVSSYKYQSTLLPQRGWGQTLWRWMSEYTCPAQHLDVQEWWKIQRKAFTWGRGRQEWGRGHANSLGPIQLPERCCLQSPVKNLSAVVLLS